MENVKPVICTVWFGGREFQHITWKGMPDVTITWAVWKHVNASVMRAKFMGRREHGRNITEQEK